MDSNKRFKVVPFAFETSNSIVYRHMITDKKTPVLEANQWILQKGIRSEKTGWEYANDIIPLSLCIKPKMGFFVDLARKL